MISKTIKIAITLLIGQVLISVASPEGDATFDVWNSIKNHPQNEWSAILPRTQYGFDCLDFSEKCQRITSEQFITILIYLGKQIRTVNIYGCKGLTDDALCVFLISPCQEISQLIYGDNTIITTMGEEFLLGISHYEKRTVPLSVTRKIPDENTYKKIRSAFSKTYHMF